MDQQAVGLYCWDVCCAWRSRNGGPTHGRGKGGGIASLYINNCREEKEREPKWKDTQRATGRSSRAQVQGVAEGAGNRTPNTRSVPQGLVGVLVRGPTPGAV